MKTEQTAVNQVESASFLSSWFSRQDALFNEYRFGMMAIFLTLQSCLGSVACMYILQSNASDLLLIGCASITMASNAAFIAMAPTRWCLAMFYLSLVFNTISIFVTF